tara:strand:- start:123 stop:659 length:537 start_codon:yes stop_codon:yes gene_type:complete
MSTNIKKPIGIFGGSFDPPHIGHLYISKYSVKKLKLKKLYWVITKKNPLKKKPFFSLDYRIRKCKEIIKGNKKMQILFLEKKLRSNRSIEIIKYFAKNHPGSNIFFIIGSDNILSLKKWHKWKLIPNYAKVVVFSRKGFDSKAKKSAILKFLKKNIIFINNKKINISSSEIKRKLIMN